MNMIRAYRLRKNEAHPCGYETVGDWQFDEFGNLVVSVSTMGDQDSEFAVAIHEMFEAWACKKMGITEQQVSAFDMKFEQERSMEAHSPKAEPGDDPRAPYRREHQMATTVEMMVLTLLGKSWPDHNESIE